MKKVHTFTIFLLVILFVLVSCSKTQNNEIPAEKETIQETIPESSGIDEATNIEENSDNKTSDLNVLEDLENSFDIINAFPGLSFVQPLELQNAADGSGRIFVVEKSGKIFLIRNPEAQIAELFLDISGRVDNDGGEKGLLGLAFHPDFKNNAYIFVNYTTHDSTIVSRFMVNQDNSNSVDAESEEIIITFKQPYSNHNGGKIEFGPNDGFLYISTGDGGSAGDPQNNGQSLNTLLGKILRIDIDSENNGLNYSIPSDNPFKDNQENYREEIYAYGLRNPWKFSFDYNGNLWVADVGQDSIEEINIVEKGKNYGWNIMEGSNCYEPPTGCNPEGLELPIYEYEHPLGKSITGGHVYNGKAIPQLKGIYVYADFVTGYIWGLEYAEGNALSNYTLAKTNLNISSFGLDEEQELYFTSFDGKIYKLGLP